jgi:hypothetical protein
MSIFLKGMRVRKGVRILKNLQERECGHMPAKMHCWRGLTAVTIQSTIGAELLE